MKLCKWCKKEVESINYYELCAECVNEINSDALKKQNEIHEALTSFNRSKTKESKENRAPVLIEAVESFSIYEQERIFLIKPSVADVIQSIRRALEDQTVAVVKPKLLDNPIPGRKKKGERITFPSKVRGVTFQCPYTKVQRQYIIKNWVHTGDRLIPKFEPHSEYGDSAIGLWFHNGTHWFHLGYLGHDVAEEVLSPLLEGEKVEIVVIEVTGGENNKSYGVNFRISFFQEKPEIKKKEIQELSLPIWGWIEDDIKLTVGTCKWCKKENEDLNYYGVCRDCTAIIDSHVSEKQKKVYEELNSFNRCRNFDSKKQHAEAAIAAAETMIPYEQLHIAVINLPIADIIQSVRGALENQEIEVKKPKKLEFLPPNRPTKKEKHKLTSIVEDVLSSCPNTKVNRQRIIQERLSSKCKLIPRLEPYNSQNDCAVGLWFLADQTWFHVGYIDSNNEKEVKRALLEGRDVNVTVARMTTRVNYENSEDDISEDDSEFNVSVSRMTTRVNYESSEDDISENYSGFNVNISYY